MNTDGPTAPRNRDQQQQKVDFTSNALDGECSDCEGVSSSSGGSYYDSAGGGGGNKKREDPPSSLLQTPAQLPRDELTAAANNDPPMNSTAVFKFDRDFSRLTTNTPGNFAAVGQTPMTGASLGSINPTPHTTTGRGILKSSNYKTATVNALDAPMNTGISAMGLVRGNNPLGPTPLVRRNDSGKNKQQEDPQQQQQQQKLPTPSPGMHYHFPAVSSVKTFDAFPPPKKRMSAVEEEDPNMLRYASTAGSDQSPLVTKGSTMEDDTNENENSQTPLTQPQTQTDCSLGDPSASGVSPQEKHQHPQSAGKYPAALSEFPFYFDGYASWVCRHCNHISPYYRGENYVWHYPQAPPNEFVDQHLVVCHGLNASSDHAAQQPPHALTDFRFHPTAPQMPGMPPSFGNKMGAPDPPTGRSPPPILPKNNSENKALGAHQYFPRQPYHPQSIPMMPHQQPYMMPPPGAQQPPFPFGLNGTKPKRRSTGKNISPKGRPSDDQTYAKAIEHLEEVEENMADLTQPNTDIGSSLVEQSDSDLITDYFFHIMKQLIVCRFAEADRKTRGGKRENINIGYGGLQCRHCSQTPCTRKFYWSNVDRLSNSFAEIPTHVLKCKYTPEDIKDSLLVLKGRHAEQMQSLARGSQKVFFRRMWRRLHDGDETGGATPISQKSSKDVGETGIDAVKTSKSTAARMLADSLAAESVEPSSRDAGITESPKIVLLAIPEDQDWLSDDQCLVRNNIEVFVATNHDCRVAVEERKYPIKPGWVGLRCIHCAKTRHGARGAAVLYPYSVSGIYESVREFQRMHFEKCPNLPLNVVESAQSNNNASSTLSSVLRRYYVQSARALGLVDNPDGGVKAGAKPETVFSGGFATTPPKSSSTPSRPTSLDDQANLLLQMSRKRKAQPDLFDEVHSPTKKQNTSSDEEMKEEV